MVNPRRSESKSEARSGTVKRGVPKSGEAPATRNRASYVSQTDVPARTLEEALRVPQAIAAQYARKPTPPLRVASAMGVQPNTGNFRMLTGAAIAYGLTKGGAQAPQIEIEPLGMRIVRPTKEGDDQLARREALLRPRVISEFLRQYDGSPVPRRDIAINVLGDMGVPDDRAEQVFDLIVESARSVGFIHAIKDKEYVDLQGTPAPAVDDTDKADDDSEGDAGSHIPEEDAEALAPAVSPAITHPPASGLGGARPLPQGAALDAAAKRVYVTHGKNRDFVEPIKKLIGFGKLEPVVSVERQSVSKPVPDKVMQDMRGCGAAIIHVDKEAVLHDGDGTEHVQVNPNVLIEIGAAMALFGRRFILLVREGVQLPSNLQGLYEVRYRGELLDADVTIRLLEAINDIQNNPIPNRYVTDA